jgi:membrane protein YdbS with pleckstrin-like domain
MRAPFESGLPQSVPRRERIARDTARAMHEVAWRSPSSRLLTMRRTEVAAVALPLAALAFALLLAAGELAVGAIAAAAVLAAGALAFVFVTRRVRAWGYAERDDDLLVRKGIMFRTLVVVPYGRMQYVDVQAGPLDRRLGIAQVQLHTAAAATDATIPGLPPEEAERLRDRLSARGEARLAGL